jgi:hypothetical protein
MKGGRSRSRSPVKKERQRSRSRESSAVAASGGAGTQTGGPASEGGGGGGGAVRCKKDGCEFYASMAGFCTEHSPAGLNDIKATAADRQKASDFAVQAFDRKQPLERFNCKFRPFVMNEMSFNALIKEMKDTPLQPRALWERLRTGRWLLTHTQALALQESTGAAFDEQNKPSSEEKRRRYEDAIFSRCIDRDKLHPQGREGYYIDEFDSIRSAFLRNSVNKTIDTLFVPFEEYEGPKWI